MAFFFHTHLVWEAVPESVCRTVGACRSWMRLICDSKGEPVCVPGFQLVTVYLIISLAIHTGIQSLTTRLFPSFSFLPTHMHLARWTDPCTLWFRYSQSIYSL